MTSSYFVPRPISSLIALLLVAPFVGRAAPKEQRPDERVAQTTIVADTSPTQEEALSNNRRTKLIPKGNASTWFYVSLTIVLSGLTVSIASYVFNNRVSRRLKRLSEERASAEHQVEKLTSILQSRAQAGISYPETSPSKDHAGSAPPTGSVAPIPDGLVSALISGNCVLFAGNGVAAQAGCPTYSIGLRKVLEQAKERAPSHDWDSLQKALDQGEVSSVAELIRSRLPQDTLAEICGKVFAGGRVRGPGLHAQLRDLPFAGAITACWDDSLEIAFQDRYPQVFTPTNSQFGEIARTKRFFLLKLYGDPNSLPDFFFTPQEYRQALYENENFSKFVNSLYLSNTLVFAGATASEIEEYFLSGLRISPDENRRHFAIVPTQPGKEIESERFRIRYGIELLCYTPTASDPQLVEFFKELSGRLGPKTMAPAVPSFVAQTIDRIRLENIGTFENLELSFDPKWNVLLGNNGCGKSSILKAIALGLCGDDLNARGAAALLLRAGSDKGIIELWVGQQKYTTTLIRRRPGSEEVNVKCEQVTPLQAGRWAVLGFPPLRGVSMQELRGPSTSERSSEPDVKDLLPLISGSVDNRLDDVKQWIFDLAVIAETGSSNTSNDESIRSRRLIDSFFSLLGQFTPGVTCKFDSISLNPGRVIVETQDGKVPLETISQGTSSVLGWVGTLLQRMYDIYRSSENPETQPALVLVDEIDAHMHPEWQQMIVPLVSEKFPNLQIIATTHSPLIVSGMPVSQVTRFERNKLGKVQKAEISPEMMFGRPDQVLAGDLFRLNSLFDKATQDQTKRYQELLGKRDDRTADEETEFQQLRREIRVRVPMSATEPPERLAQEVVDTILREQLGGDFPEVQSEALKKVENLLNDIQKRQKDLV